MIDTIYISILKAESPLSTLLFRLSASKQLYEQVSCDEPDSESSEFVKPGRALALVPNSGKDSGFDDPGSDSDNALLATPKHD